MSPDIFLDCIILLIHDSSERHRLMAKELIDHHTESIAKNIGSSENDNIIQFYVRFIRSILENKFDPSNEKDRKHYLLKLKSDPIMQQKRDLYDLLCDTLGSREKISSAKLESIADGMQNEILFIKLNKVARNLFGKLGRARDVPSSIDKTNALKGILTDLTEAIEVGTKSIASTSNTIVIDRVNFLDKKSMSIAIKKHTERTCTGIIKFGLQGLNRMFGKQGGASRGESIVFNALSHHYKSGMLQSIAMWAALYNSPVTEKGKKPLCLFISIENEAYQNFIWIGKKVYRRVVGKDPDVLNEDELVNWIYSEFSKNGCELEIMRCLPDQFGYDEFVAIVTELENSGYEIYMAVIDYMNNMKKSSASAASGAGNHLAVKELYSKICNFTKTKGITLATAHQLNRRAAELANSGKTNAVKYFGIEHLSDTSDVQREIDTSIYIHIEKNHEGLPFLTMSRSKRRYDDTTPETHKFCAYPFTQHGIMDDLGLIPGFTSDIYSWSIDNKIDEVKNTTTVNEVF